MDPIFKLQIRNASKLLLNQYSRLEIVDVLIKAGITPKGVLENKSKKELLRKSLKDITKTKCIELLKIIGKETSAKIPDKEHISSNIILHPSFVNTKVEKFLKSGHYEEAVRVAFLRINNLVKQRTGLSLDGASLMRSAFSPNNPQISFNSGSTKEEKDEQEGLMHIFEGGMLAFRNPPSHNDEKIISKTKAEQIINLANFLISLLN